MKKNIILICFVFLFSCEKNKEKTPETVYEMLQGEWRNVKNESDFMVFTGNHLKNNSNGSSVDEPFTLSNKCEDAGHPDSDMLPLEADKFISCKSGQCWHIDAINPKKIRISWLPNNGNYDEYIKVKQGTDQPNDKMEENQSIGDTRLNDTKNISLKDLYFQFADSRIDKVKMVYGEDDSHDILRSDSNVLSYYIYYDKIKVDGQTRPIVFFTLRNERGNDIVEEIKISDYGRTVYWNDFTYVTLRKN